ncbi:Pentatricopeptide repeat-containing protein ELI1-chloroplastic [Striga hermonthica]|uniref:Pentatricopeptide repeat-containing protein ELI1-chloroplastic n=1 Tax=Striga hermonthica TaxID=68872 RepID=A0A9N7MES0_STRHE|nr:Pentatricopeptide repeat-containing protein ELI1-chloroplastic [Striga hermonthica]
MSSTSPILAQPTPHFSINADKNQYRRPENLTLLIENCRSIKRLTQIHAFLIRRGLETETILNFKLLKSYSSLGHVQNSLSIFNATGNPNVYSYTAIIHGHATYGLHERALRFYSQMFTEKVEPNAFTLSAVLKASALETGKSLHCHAYKLGVESNNYVRTGLVDVYARGGDVASARKVFETMPEKNMISSTAMITGYAKNGDIDEARKLFDSMDERDVVSWTVIIGGYAQHGSPNEALTLFRKMMRSGLRPNEATMLAVLTACGQVGALESGRWAHSYLAHSKTCTIDARVGSALIDMYGKCGSLEDALSVFDGIRDKDVVVYNAMIGAYAIHGLSGDALNLFREMRESGLPPTDITFIGVLSSCAHAGAVSDAWTIFDSMEKEYGMKPKVEHYGCMVNLLGRAGRLDEAYRLATSIAELGDPVLWGTLLDACRLHKNVGLGEKIFEHLVECGQAESGAHVLLSNIYAGSGDWCGVSRMRARMKECGVRKEPGCSSIEVDNEVHEFLAGDVKHPRAKEIYGMLGKMSGWVKERGYTAQTEGVLHDIGEWEKERSLEVHSEKLALAFGLISTGPGTTVKIVKNLRVCVDCHEVIKRVSGITGRKIVMRDRTRFHHFVGGVCSCGDYW